MPIEGEVGARGWEPASWRQFEALQQPEYPDAAQLERVIAELRALPPLVTSWEIVQLREQLAEAADGRRFVLQAGDCAERFADCASPRITNMLKILLQMSLVMVVGAQRPVIRMGRFGGQYAKPRSSATESRNGVNLPSYRGDLVNGSAFSPEERTPDPARLLRGYSHAALTLNFVRALVKGGFADLHHPEYFDLDWARRSPLADEYRRMASTVSDSLRFMENVLGVRAGESDRIDFFTAHEALHLGYEEAQTRRVPRRPGWFNLTTHFPWVGLRTHQPGGAHVEYLRGIENPVGLKVGPGFTPEVVERWFDALDPQRSAGRLTLIHRFGRRRIADELPRLISAVRTAGGRPVWVSDPMHGNTQSASNGLKTRSFEDIYSEAEQAFDIHREWGGQLGGVHLELTGDNVTECTGGASGPSEEELPLAYRSEVDPRLNYEQSLEMAFLIARKLRSDAGR